MCTYMYIYSYVPEIAYKGKEAPTGTDLIKSVPVGVRYFHQEQLLKC